jgi:hypothetical protein
MRDTRVDEEGNMGLFRKGQRGATWQMLAELEAMGHELLLCDEQGITGTEASERASTVSRAVIKEIGGIDYLAGLMAGLRTAPPEQHEELFFKRRGYNVARARLFPNSGQRQ